VKTLSASAQQNDDRHWVTQKKQRVMKLSPSRFGAKHNANRFAASKAGHGRKNPRAMYNDK